MKLIGYVILNTDDLSVYKTGGLKSSAKIYKSKKKAESVLKIQDNIYHVGPDSKVIPVWIFESDLD